MEDELVNIETAKLAKEKGFSVDTALSLNSSNVIKHQYSSSVDGCKISWSKYDKSLRLPTQSLLQKWLREEHKILLVTLPWKDLNDDVNDEHRFRPMIVGYKTWEEFKTYEEALEKGLQEALKLIDK